MNDREGHAAGDSLLRDLVALLRSKLRPYDPVVRWGGDEFVCTIADTDLATARSRFEEIRLALAKVDRIRGNAPAQVHSRAALFGLLESGAVEQAVTELGSHLADAEDSMLRALDLRGPTSP